MTRKLEDVIGLERLLHSLGGGLVMVVWPNNRFSAHWWSPIKINYYQQGRVYLLQKQTQGKETGFRIRRGEFALG